MSMRSVEGALDASPLTRPFRRRDNAFIGRGKRMKRWVVPAVLSVVCGACAARPAAPTPDIGAINTAALETVWAQSTQAAHAAGDATTQTALAVIAAGTQTADIRMQNATQTQVIRGLQTLAAQPTAPPSETPTPTETLEPSLTADRGDGYFLIGQEIAAGIWRNDGTGTDCTWETTTKTGRVIDTYTGLGGGTAYIAEGTFQVRFEGCGTWTYLGPP
jgi:hypothetical protein